MAFRTFGDEFMDIRDVQYFLALAEIKNFTKTAESFYITQSALSQKIGRLEKEVGMTLFYRSNRAVSLTSAGKVFELRAREVMDAWIRFHQAIEEYKSLRFTDLNIGIFMQAAFSEISMWITNFIISNPDYNINVVTENDMNLINGLREEKYDFIFLRCKESDIPPGLAFTPLYQDDLGILLHEDDPLANRDYVERSDIVHYNLICEKAGITNTYETLKAGFGLHNLNLPKPFAHTDNVHLLAELISKPQYYAFTTHESGILLQKKFSYIRYVPHKPYQLSTSYILYSKANKAYTRHPFYKYFVQRVKEQGRSGG